MKISYFQTLIDMPPHTRAYVRKQATIEEGWDAFLEWVRITYWQLTDQLKFVIPRLSRTLMGGGWKYTSRPSIQLPPSDNFVWAFGMHGTHVPGIWTSNGGRYNDARDVLRLNLHPYTHPEDDD